MFKIGDRVESDLYGKGTIICIRDILKVKHKFNVLVQFDEISKRDLLKLDIHSFNEYGRSAIKWQYENVDANIRLLPNECKLCGTTKEKDIYVRERARIGYSKDYKFSISVSDGGGGWGSSEGGIKFNYCPLCGRKIEGVE